MSLGEVGHCPRHQLQSKSDFAQGKKQPLRTESSLAPSEATDFMWNCIGKLKPKGTLKKKKKKMEILVNSSEKAGSSIKAQAI